MLLSYLELTSALNDGVALDPVLQEEPHPQLWVEVGALVVNRVVVGIQLLAFLDGNLEGIQSYKQMHTHSTLVALPIDLKSPNDLYMHCMWGGPDIFGI